MESLLDNDLYKFTMLHAVWQLYPKAHVRYQFINRRQTDHFSAECVAQIEQRIDELCTLRFADDEIVFLRNLDLFAPRFLEFLKDFQLKRNTIEVTLADGELSLWIEGTWVDTMLLEVPLMAIISECYFQTVDTNWDEDIDAYFAKALEKGKRMTRAGCVFADFGTRRRRAFAYQEAVVRAFNDAEGTTFVGTSNVHLTKQYNVAPIGTMAHEWIMGHAGMGGILGANERALKAWQQVYGDKLRIALTDTYTTDQFLREFHGALARDYDGVRHDSECPIAFTDKIVTFYKDQGIDPLTKRAVFSDGLDVDKAIEIQKYARRKITPVFGIGTHFTNDFPGSKALNIVIKLYTINGVEVAKISDNPGKASGSAKAIETALAALPQKMEG